MDFWAQDAGGLGALPVSMRIFLRMFHFCRDGGGCVSRKLHIVAELEENFRNVAKRSILQPVVFSACYKLGANTLI
jgi:hypothetical protein